MKFGSRNFPYYYLQNRFRWILFSFEWNFCCYSKSKKVNLKLNSRSLSWNRARLWPRLTVVEKTNRPSPIFYTKLTFLRGLLMTKMFENRCILLRTKQHIPHWATLNLNGSWILPFWFSDVLLQFYRQKWGKKKNWTFEKIGFFCLEGVKMMILLRLRQFWKNS